MSGFFNYENKIFQGLNKLVDCFYLSILWFLFCIPIFTAGASTTALYYAVHKVLRGERGYVFQSFFGAFKSNFKQATVMWLILLVAGILLCLDAWITRGFLEAGNKMGMLYYVFLMTILFEIIWGIYIFAYTARFENTKRAIFKNAALIAVANLPWTVLITVIAVICYLLVLIVPPLIFIIPALCTWFLNLILEKIFRKYMSPEDLEREKETDMINQR